MTATDTTSSTTIHSHAPAAGAPTAGRSPRAPHEHAWVTRSAHRTSDGVVRYVRCVGCDVQRIDLAACLGTPATPLTRPIAAVGSSLA